MVVRPEEASSYQNLIDRIGLEEVTILTIGAVGVQPTRNNILKHADSGHMALVDDDLKFLIRRSEKAYNLRNQTSEEIIDMFTCVDTTLSTFAHVGISCREGNNRVEEYSVLNTRCIRLVGLDLDVLNKEGIDYRLDNREDFDLTLRLLRLGYPNMVYYWWAQGQAESMAPGGMSGAPERELDALKANAEYLAELHPGFVRVVKKKTKGAWQGQERYDVVCYWKKAFKSSEEEK
ncbi:MAG: hypothetical protein KAR40_06285 [Candidatus Sabulitectum sp.]|nr:hypothetical protein [Candidatus Sabulitectum sp.]